MKVTKEQALFYKGLGAAAQDMQEAIFDGDKLGEWLDGNVMSFFRDPPDHNSPYQRGYFQFLLDEREMMKVRGEKVTDVKELFMEARS